MSLKEKITADLKEAMKSKDVDKRDTLRLLESAIKNEEIASGKRQGGLSDNEMVVIIQRSIKQRRESKDQYLRGNRVDLAAKEQKEIDILEEYLPPQLGEDEIRRIIREEIKQGGISDFGRLMGRTMAKLKGQADGSVVKKIAEEELEK